MDLMIVDDSSVMRRTLEMYLKDYDINIVACAGNGKDAIRIFEEKKPDVVTLDITMPEMDGISCLKEIISIKPETKVMVITALSDKLTGLIALNNGARSYLFKPVTEKELIKAFNKLLDKE